MKRTSSLTRWSSLTAVAFAFMVSSTASAQDAGTASPVTFGVVAGASIPLGDFGDFAETGWHAGALVEWNSPVFPLGIRVDGVYHAFGDKSTVESNASIVAGTVNGVWLFPMTQPSTVRPYLIGGGGIYNERCDGCESQTKFGLNGGAGVSIPLSGFTSIIEARFHIVFDSDAGSSNTTFIPISVGLLFR